MLQHAWKLPLLDLLTHPEQVEIAPSISEDTHWGYFDSREEAEAALRPRKVIAHEHDNAGFNSLDSFLSVHSFDYPAMFFLQKLAKEGKLKAVTDLVGQLGPKYTSYRKYVDFPNDFVWQIVGRSALRLDCERLSLTNGAALRFHEHVEDTKPCSVLICSGVLPYLDTPFEQILQNLPAKPPMIILNEVSVAEKAGFYMLETLGGSQVLHKAMALPEIEQIRKNLGYKLVSRWDIPERSFILGSLNGSETVQMIGEAWSL
jgi:putative methyltransferase (TIGR04325 family)